MPNKRGRPSLTTVAHRATANAHLDQVAADRDWAAYWAAYPARTPAEARTAHQGAALYGALRTWQRTAGQPLLEARAGWADERRAA